jgi:hypothetical protein
MKSVLDNKIYYFWFSEQAVLRSGQLWLTLVEFESAKEPENVEILGHSFENMHRFEPAIDGRRVIVHFADVICFHVFDEFARLENYNGEERETDVLALHKNSTLIAWLKESTVLHHTTNGELLHYSVLTANEYYHVITREEPSVLVAP